MAVGATEPVNADGTRLHGNPQPVSRNTVTTGISLAAGLLLLAGCSSGGQTGQAAQDTTETGTSSSTSSDAGVSLPERTAPAKSLDLADPCTIITQQQATKLGVNQPTEARTSNGKEGCDYQKGKAGSDNGWVMFAAADPNRTTQEFADKRPSGKITEVADYPAYQVENYHGCLLAVDVTASGSLFINGVTRLQTRPEACSVATEFAETAVENLPNT
ncbi:DUF3558 family protein [Actinopolyspora xinjiangensis]|uniref:DUF3558 family protein n=1 Tax=Actinopolyspora xinjiangensis TaxID=405564 RepID=UPI00147EE637|nr:DUF3558 family protein [Actinopolyspora xinjiangensis]